MPTQTSKFTLPRPISTDAFNLASQQALIDAIDTNIANKVQMTKLTQDTGQTFDITLQNLNDLTGTRFCYGQNLINAPTNVFYRVLQFETNQTTRTQVLISNTGQLYIRSMVSGTYNSWAQVTTSADDSGWLTATLLNGVQPFNTGQELQYRKIGNRVDLRGALKNITSFPTTIATLPSGFRPIGMAVPFTMPSSLDNGEATMYRGVISTGGDIIIEGKSGAATTSATWYPVRCTFLID